MTDLDSTEDQDRFRRVDELHKKYLLITKGFRSYRWSRRGHRAATDRSALPEPLHSRRRAGLAKTLMVSTLASYSIKLPPNPLRPTYAL